MASSTPPIVRVRVAAAASPTPPGSRSSRIGDRRPRYDFGGPMAENPAYTFETFVVSGSSEGAWTACVDVAADPGRAYNPLFLYGPTASGKSHLLHAIASGIRHRRPEAAIQRLAADTFIARLVASIRSNAVPAFERTMAAVDALLLDDLGVANKPNTQRQVLHQLGELVSAGMQVVVTCHTPPNNVIGAWLASFPRARNAELAYPDRDARAEILRRAALRRGVPLTEAAAQALADRSDSSPRTLESIINQLAASAIGGEKP
jgi:chromosomal replication initiator protein